MVKFGMPRVLFTATAARLKEGVVLVKFDGNY